MQCNRETEVFSRVVGYHRPVKLWNKGKQEEFKDRAEYAIPASMPDEQEETAEQEAAVTA